MGPHETSSAGTERAADCSLESDAAEVPTARISDLLTDARRRYVLYYLVGSDYAASVEEITEQVAVWETETSAPEIDPEVYEEVRAELVHVHLPKLVDADAVEYDEDSDLITLADGNDRLTEELYRSAEREHERR